MIRMYTEHLIMIFSSLFIRRVSSMKLSLTKYEILAHGAGSFAVKQRFINPLHYSSRSKARGGRGVSLSMWGEGSTGTSPFKDDSNKESPKKFISRNPSSSKTSVDDEGRKIRVKRDPIDGSNSRSDGSLNRWDESDDTSATTRRKSLDQTSAGGGWDDVDDNEKKLKENKRRINTGGWDDSNDEGSESFSRGRRNNSGSNYNENGRRNSSGRTRSGGWDEFDTDEKKPRVSSDTKRIAVGGWDDTDDSNSEDGDRFPRDRKFNAAPFQSRGRDNRPDRRPDSSSSFNRPRFQGSNSYKQRGSYEGNDSTRRSIRPDMQDFKDNREGKINMRALELAGYVHLYGLAPILNALSSDRRSLDVIETPLQETEQSSVEISPEARLAPCLFIQDRVVDGKSGDKAAAAREIEDLAKRRGLAITYVDKGILNTLCDSRPHQGYVLRCGQLNFELLNRIPEASKDNSCPNLWLVLDEVVDPQNFGALLRSAYFLGGSQQHQGGIGVLICEKNSAPPSPVVSAASAGALELTRVFSTTNLPRTLNAARDDGWRIVGAAVSAPSGMIDESTGEAPKCYDLFDLASARDRPTLLVLGSEGQGLRKLVARACTEFVRIPGMVQEESKEDDFTPPSRVGVDSLNVSVSGGIILWHLLYGSK